MSTKIRTCCASIDYNVKTSYNCNTADINYNHVCTTKKETLQAPSVRAVWIQGLITS